MASRAQISFAVNLVRGARKEITYKVPKRTAKYKLAKLEQTLNPAAYEILHNYGVEIREVMLAQYDATAKNYKPRRLTGRLRAAIDYSNVTQRGGKFFLKVIKRENLPIYWQVQERGRGPYTFTQYFIPVCGKYGRSGTKRYKLMTISNATALSLPKRDQKKLYKMTVHHPGVARRGWLSLGLYYIDRTIKDVPRQIFRRALEI